MGRVTDWDTPTTTTSTNGNFGNKNLPGFFNLANDGDEAIVRFMHDSIDEFEVYSVHPIELTTPDGKKRYPKIYCLREDASQPMDKCPLCAAGEKLQKRIYIHLIQYVKDETGHIVPMEKVWDRNLDYARKLKNLMFEYGPLSDCIFKVKRNGAKGSTDTTYEIMYGSPNMYPAETYPKMPEAFKGYTALGNMVQNKDWNEMTEFVRTGNFPFNPSPSNNDSTPKAPAAQQTFNQPAYAPQPTFTQAQYTPSPQAYAPVDTPPWDTPFNQAPSAPQSNPWDNRAQSVQRPVREY